MLADQRTARLLAVFEMQTPADAFPSRDLVMAARDLEVDADGLWDFLDLVTQEIIDRQLPPEVLAAGLREAWSRIRHRLRTCRASSVLARCGRSTHIGPPASRL